MIKSHCIITGTGRTGTTLIIQILTKLGLDTGFNEKDMNDHIYSNCNAGLERNIMDKDAPYIIKDPWICDTIPDILANKSIKIDHVFIPIREMKMAALSRIKVSKQADEQAREKGVNGGLWHTNNPDDQEYVLHKQLSKLLVELSKESIPITFINYPKLAYEPLYLFEKLGPALKHLSYKEFKKAWKQTVRLDLIHTFK